MKTILMQAIIVMVFVCGGVGLSAANTDSLPVDVQADLHLAKAKKYIEQKKYKRADREFQEILALDIQVPSVFFYHYGVNKLKLKDYKNAEALLKEFILNCDRKSSEYTKAIELLADISVVTSVSLPSNYTDSETGMEFVLVKGGCFQMGSPSREDGLEYIGEDPVHEVCVDDFYLGKYEVTNEQYRKYRPVHNSGSFVDDGLNGRNQPVVNVSWQDADGYARWLSKKSGKKYSLPTEAQWEYAARGGTDTARFWGNSPDDACSYANVADRTLYRKWGDLFEIHDCADGYVVTAPVGSFKPNGYGLYDMLGNVWEWCQDWYGEEYYSSSPRQNPTGPALGKYRVNRGGGWNNDPRLVRAAYRDWDSPGGAYNGLGFRLAFPVQQHAIR